MEAHKLFSQIFKNPKPFVAAGTGEEFEKRIENALDKLGYNRILSKDIEKDAWQSFKESRNRKWSSEKILNQTSYNKHYIFQPSGSQNYPDFAIFGEKHILCVEVKFNKGNQGKPVWNSGLPRPNGIYIFGSYALQDVSFIIGADAVSPDEARMLHEFFKNMRDYQYKFNKDKMGKQERGFSVYIRIAFDQSKVSNKSANTNYFNHPARRTIEKKVIEYIKSL